MTDQTDGARQHVSPSLADRHLEFELAAEAERLKAEPKWSSGHSARTLIKYDDLRVVLLAMAAGQRMAEHKAEGRITVHVVSGHIQLGVSDKTFDLRTGGLLALDRAVPHDVIAIEESVFLLTIAWPIRA